MALVADPGTAGLLAAVVFLVVLGFLVVFVESIRSERLLPVLGVDVAVAGVLALLGEFGLSLVVAAVALALLANHAFEWLTTR